jgi:hypothetical protein
LLGPPLRKHKIPKAIVRKIQRRQRPIVGEDIRDVSLDIREPAIWLYR